MASYPVKRPLMVAVGCLIAGIIGARYGQGTLLAVLALFIGVFVHSGRSKWLMVGAFCVGVALWHYAMLPEACLAPYQGQMVQLTGRISDCPREAYYVVIAVEAVNGERINHGGHVAVSKHFKDENSYERGFLVQVQGMMKPLLGATNPGGFSAKDYWNSRGVFYQLKAKEDLHVLADSQGIWRLSNRLRAQLEQKFKQTLPAEQAGLVQALLLGEKEALDEDFYSLSQKWGIAHIFAVSGLHIGYLVMVFLGVMRLFRWERSYLAVILLGGILGIYCFMIGCPPSALRASVMAIAGVLAGKWLRYKDMYTILSLAALVILVGQPQALWSVGFQLSFAVTWGLLYLTPTFTKRLSFVKWSWLRSGLSVALAAQLASAPLTAWHFYLFSAYAPLLNLLVVPIIGLLVPLLIIALALSFVLPPLSGLAFWPSELLIRVLMVLLEQIAKWLGTGHIYIGGPHWLGMVGYLGLLIAWRQGWLTKLGGRMADWVCVGCLVAIVLGSLPGTPKQDQVTFLDVGQGSSAVVQTHQGRVFVFDGGVTSSSTANYLRYSGVNTIDAIILSHGDIDHTTGLLTLFKDFRVRYFLLADNVLSEEEAQLVQLALAQQSTILFINQENTLHFGDNCRLTAGVYGNVGGSANDRELIASWDNGVICAAFPGDSAQAGLEQWLRDGGRMIDIWAIPHHGSKNSCYPGLYQRIQPKVAVISVGRDNSYGHPHEEVLDALRAEGIRYYRTDECGAVTIKIGEDKLIVQPYLN